ncbi:pyridoxine 5'-phosphate synthase [Candidatus Velamenicoccus archaeovorus]|uniref:Pyridoxine 5'-phosphate synthase n=1 Tax=Velamenicoccus archaeovorus TaxID=1930593 RepID=A0A410P4R4_VELA1|nr:pyridoxine 5'-phosphate synthase [Candidatus Velamenicoccus archaeovorus]QAT17113.1 pyridoxine 5'-phosphate synthase [Candidatus Velamenicoccus archaeovorus]
MPLLGVNIDHIATLRQQRRAPYPDLLFAARICENAGADSIVAHLREDRRHIQDVDVFALRKTVTKKFNLEMSIADEIVGIACRLKPHQATLVPERRQELTTEGGLDVVRYGTRVARAVSRLREKNVEVSLFIESSRRQIKMARDVGAGTVELHTGRYADCRLAGARKKMLAEFREAVAYARDLGLVVNAGHGLDYENVCPVASMKGMHELNIGYAIVCFSIFLGLERAVRQMKALVTNAGKS